MSNIHTKHCETIYRPKGPIYQPKAWCFFGGILRPKRKKSDFCSGIFRRRDSTMSKWRIFIEIFIDKACEAIYKFNIDFSISTRLISIENTRDTVSQRAIYLFLNGVNPYNSIINIFKNHPCLKIFVIFVFAIQVFMTMFAFVVY